MRCNSADFAPLISAGKQLFGGLIEEEFTGTLTTFPLVAFRFVGFGTDGRRREERRKRLLEKSGRRACGEEAIHCVL